MSKRKANRRFREPPGRRLRGFIARRYRVLIAAAALPLFIYGGFRFYEGVTTSPHLAIRTIEVKGGARVSREDAVDLSGIREGDNILKINAGEAAEGVRKNPWVREASVKRAGLDCVTIEIRERTPLALIRLDGLYVMDSEGVVFKRSAPDDALDLPVITGFTEASLRDDPYGMTEKTLELLRVLKGRAGFNIENVSEIKADSAVGLSVYTLSEGVRIDVGSERFGEKFDVLEEVLRSRGGSLRGIEAVDLDNRRGVIVKFTTNMA